MENLVVRLKKLRLRPRTIALASLTLAVLIVPASQSLASVTPLGDSDWTTYGANPANTRDQPLEHDISPANVSQLGLKWKATLSGDISATPAVVGGYVYADDFGGSVWKLDANTGAVIWHDSIPTITGKTGDYARTSPAVDGNIVIVGTNLEPDLIGLNTSDGSVAWGPTPVNPYKGPPGNATMTGSPQLVGDTIITGVSASGASNPSTATFQTTLTALNALTGVQEWSTDVLPSGFTGATMFSAPAIDQQDNLVFGTFGQPYTEPAADAGCLYNQGCGPSNAYWDSIVAFNLTTGAPVWSYRIVGDAPESSVCGSQPPQVTWCFPDTDTPDAPASVRTGFGDAWDIGGSSPNVFNLNGEQVVGFGAKAGVYYLFDAVTGALKWNTLVGPGGDQGGFEWGSAYDGQLIYVSLTDQHHIPYYLTEGGVLQTSGPQVTGGSWAALNPSNGEIEWQTPDPQTETVPNFTNVGVWDLGPATVANGVDYVASMAKTGAEMYALDAATGSILWSYSAGSAVNAGPAIVDGSVYWGSGYSKSGVEGSGNNTLFAFSIGGTVDTTPPTTSIAVNGALQDGWYNGSEPVTVNVTATDAGNNGSPGSGVYQTRCVLDPATVPTSFADLPAGNCSLSTVTGDGTHTVYAASIDNDNNVESGVASATFKIDATPPTIVAAATTPPNANGWYSGPVVVHFTCTDSGSGIPAGTCPPDQTLSGIGTAISSTAETVTDNAGNVSAPSNVVTVKIVNTAGLCALTGSDIQGSGKYQALKPLQKAIVNAIVTGSCQALTAIVPKLTAPQKQILVALYEQLVGVLAQQGWLTAAQASNLDALAAGL